MGSKQHCSSSNSQHGQHHRTWQHVLISQTLTPPAPQASESRLYTFSQETKDALRKFRLSTSRAKDPQAIICELPPEDLS